MSKIHFLPVRYGDSFVIECDKGGNHGVIVVDGGPSTKERGLREKIQEMDVTPDLLVLTHYDDDHINGLTKYIQTCMMESRNPAKEVWANCKGWPAEFEMPPLGGVATRSIPQAVSLARILETCANRFGIRWKSRVSEGGEQEYPFASIEVISPIEEVVEKIIEKQEEVAEGMPMTRAAIKLDRLDDLRIPLEELAKEEPKAPNYNTPSELANASSIGMIVRCDDLSILMLGDCYPHNAEAYLRSKGYSEENPLVVDYVKVAHHGSRHNTNNSFLDIIRCNNYIISTNGEKFKHPDRSSIAHILCHPNRRMDETVHIYLDYPMDEIVDKRECPFLNDGELEKWNAVIHDNETEIIPEAAAPAQPEISYVELKSLKKAQANDLLGLMRELNPDIPVTDKMLQRVARISATHLFAALAGERIIGCASLCPYESPTGRKASIEDVVVTSAFRGQGIGRRLMEEVIAFARRELLPVDLHLTSSPWRTEANELYQSLGFFQRDTNMYRLTLEVD